MVKNQDTLIGVVIEERKDRDATAAENIHVTQNNANTTSNIGQETMETRYVSLLLDTKPVTNEDN